MKFPNAMQGVRVRWGSDALYWKKIVPPSALATLLLGIFFLFASFGLVIMMVGAAKATVYSALLMAGMSGLFSVGLAYSAFRANIKLTIAVVAVEVIALLLSPRLIAEDVSPSSFSQQVMQRRLAIEGSLTMALIVWGYICIIAFVRKEGLRVFGTMAEMKLATEVHQALAPSISRHIGGFEIYGASVPSGEMGGDLVDIIEGHQQWIAYLADVCGHGVPAGMVMAMVKSATRMGAMNTTGLSGLLSNLNRVLASSCAPNTFATFACISGNDGAALEFSLAGHLPILHFRRRSQAVEECSVSNLPLAVLPDAQFETSSIDCEAGDLLAVITDGLTEVSDAQGNEMGLEPFKGVLRSAADVPLPQLMVLLREIALKQGKQLDDQSLLLIRRV